MYVADSIKKLHEFIIRKAKNDKGRIFGENVKLFLQYMLRSDSELISADEVLSKGVYSTLVETSKWIKWTTAYCQLVIFLEGLQDANGRHSRINRFDDYAIYREVTKRNACGRRLTEQEAFAEYMTIRGKVEARFAHSYENCWYRFEMFILTTLAVLRIHRRSVSAFCTFIDYICDPLQEIDLYVDIFFKVGQSQNSSAILFVVALSYCLDLFCVDSLGAPANIQLQNCLHCRGSGV